MESKDLGLVWYNIDRLFQELEIKCEMVENAIDMLTSYKDSMDKTVEIMKNNLAILSKEVVYNDKRSSEERPKEQM